MEGVKVMPQERISDRIVEQFVDNSISQFGKEMQFVERIMEEIIEAVRLLPEECTQKL